MASLPQNLTLIQTQTKWASQLNPVISCPLINGRLLMNQTILSGANSLNHGLGRKLIGWIPVGQDGSASFYDEQDSNQMPQLTLALRSTGDCTASFWVF